MDSDLETQFDTFDDLGIEYFDFGEIGNTNILDLDDAELERIREVIDERKSVISSIRSPIGKVDVTDDFELTRDCTAFVVELVPRVYSLQ